MPRPTSLASSRATALAAGLTAAVAAAALSGPAAAVPGPAGVAAKKWANSEPVRTHWGDDRTHEGARANRGGHWVAARDRGSLLNIAKRDGAREAWSSGATGRGVTVAVIDTGITRVPGLADAHKVLDGPDLSYESQSEATRHVDGFGHGTHIGAIIAGRDPGFDPAEPDSNAFAGVAPDAQLLNVKVGTTDGGADVSQVIAAIDWVVEHRRDHGMRVRVINLSYGTHATQGWRVDPLARAVENAWNHNIVVVAAAGNDGVGNPLVMPAVDPHVIAVGAVDHVGTTTVDDDVMADFTNPGSATRAPDILAPGRSVVSLRVPGSYLDTGHPEGLVPGDAAGRFFRGSGTSQSVAVVSGEVALLLSDQPRLRPDQVKALLMRTARPLAALPAGPRVSDVSAALARARRGTPRAGDQTDLPQASGLGTLEASRGGERVLDPDTGVVLTGELDALGAPWDARGWVAAQEGQGTWHDGTWNGRRWAGTTWTGDRIDAATWSGQSWSGQPWSEHVWSESGWEGRSWRAASWLGRSWRGLL